MSDDKFTTWLNKLKNTGKTDDEMGQMLASIAKSSGLDTYHAILLSLTEEDMQMVEKIDDEKLGKEKIKELFKLRTGMTIEELTQKIQEWYFSNQK